MFLPLFYFILNVYSVGTWCEFGVIDGLISYETSDVSCYRNGWTYEREPVNEINYYTFGGSDCCVLKDMTLLFYNDDTWVKCVNFTSDNSDSILTSIKMINTYYLMQHVIDTKNMKNGITFYFGCFGTDYYSYQEHDESSSSNYNCRSSVDGTAKTNVKIYSINISTNSILQTNYINILSLNGYSITLQSFTSNRIIINSIIDDGTLYVESDCDIYSSFIPTIYPYSNVYLLNESITISIVDINIYYKPIIITSNVDIYDIIEIIIDENSDYMYTGLFEIEESTEILQIISTPITSYSNPFVLLKQQSRKLDYDSDIICDNQVIIVNPNDTICDDFNLYDHYCYLTKTNNETYYQNDYITIDYSCPCNISNSNCIFELDKNEVMIYEVNLPLTTLIIHQDVTIKPNYYDFNIQTKNDIDVTFNSINNNVIYVNDESSSFTLNLPLVGNLLLIGYLHKFSQSVTKSVTTTQSLHVSTDYCCKYRPIQFIAWVVAKQEKIGG
ncbi:hypothetical protein QTN25_008155 [Entamoeba marina]